MSWTVADAIDYKGFPADRSKTGGWVPAALILGIFSLPFLLHFSGNFSIFITRFCFIPQYNIQRPFSEKIVMYFEAA